MDEMGEILIKMMMRNRLLVAYNGKCANGFGKESLSNK